MGKIANNIALVSLAVAALACDDGNSKQRSGVAPKKALSDATAAEILRLCDWAIGQQPNPSLSDACTFVAAVDTETELECKDEVASCIDDARNPLMFASTCPFDSDGLAECPLSVGEVESCFSAIINDFEYRVARASCENVEATAPAGS